MAGEPVTGTLAAGVTTTATAPVLIGGVDANGVARTLQVNPNGSLAVAIADPLAVDFGYQTWTYDPRIIASSSALTSQTIYALGIHAYAGVTYTGVVLGVVTAGTSTAPTGFFVGVASSAATGIMQAQSSNLNASASLTATGLKKFAFSATWTPTVSGLYEIVVLQNGTFAGTNVVFGRMGVGSVNTNTDGTLFVAATAGTAQTALPANAAALPAVYSVTNALPFWAALY